MENNNQVDKEFSLNIDNIEDSEGENSNKIMWFSFVVLILALIAIAVFVFKYYEKYAIVKEITDPNQELLVEDDLSLKKKLPVEMKGKIYLTLAPKNDENNSVGLYSYNLKKEKLEEALLIEGKQFRGGEVFHTGNRILTTDGEDVFINDMADLNSQGIVFDDDIYNIKSEPVWSIGGWYTFYSAMNDLSLDINIPESWKIYSVHNDGTQKYLVDGVHPHISKDNYIVFLKNNGLYGMDLDGSNEIKIWEIEGEARTSIQLDVSHLSNLAILSNPFEASVYILKFKIAEGENFFEGETIKEIKTYGFQPTLSPDDKYLAIIEASLEKTEEYIYVRPKLVVYDLETYKRYELMDLKDYRPEEILINDWWI
ncbi:hypothetical protein KKH36_02705 [Patescibacteria group bacterium]|nr:hypothetical protein [Patescibacteria group bacterium]